MELPIQFTTDERYQAFLTRSVESEVLGIRVRIACLEDVARGKLWAYSDPRRRLSKRKKDELVSSTIQSENFSLTNFTYAATAS